MDPSTMRAYVVGESAVVNVMNFEDPESPMLEHSFNIDATGTDIEVCDGVVAVGMQATTGTTDPGK
eukprot:scaffold234804_cov41-Prasinocladus_malaysianus.AAC.1